MTNEDFKKIVEQYEKLVFTVCYQFTRDYYEAQNLAQETFLSAYSHIDKCDKDKYKPYLTRIAANKAKDHLKSAYMRKVGLSGDDTAFESAAELKRPEEMLVTKEGIDQIKETIYALKEPYLKVSVMYFLQERTTEEIATVLGRPKKTVQTQILRAKHLLKEKLRGGE